MVLNQKVTNELSLLSLATAVMWLACLAVGVLGLLIAYPRAELPAKPPDPIQAVIMKVDVLKPPTPREVTLLRPQSEPPVPQLTPPVPAVPRLAAQPQAPPLLAVAAPSPAIAFALPVQGLTQIVDSAQAGFTRPAAKPVTTASAGPSGGAPGASPSAPPQRPVVMHLTLGQGEGNQPVPDYPRDAAANGEEGTITVQLNVDSDGRVTAAEIISPCHWPLLNQSALRTVRERWHFSPGPPRVYEVAIVFHLQQ